MGPAGGQKRQERQKGLPLGLQTEVALEQGNKVESVCGWICCQGRVMTEASAKGQTWEGVGQTGSRWD